MSDLVKIADCWFSHSQAHLRKFKNEEQGGSVEAIHPKKIHVAKILKLMT